MVPMAHRRDDLSGRLTTVKIVVSVANSVVTGGGQRPYRSYQPRQDYNREGGYANREGGYNREGGFRPNNGGYRREGGYGNREGGYNREGGFRPNNGGYRREGGYGNREGGYRDNNGGGFRRPARRLWEQTARWRQVAAAPYTYHDPNAKYSMKKTD